MTIVWKVYNGSVTTIADQEGIALLRREGEKKRPRRTIGYLCSGKGPETLMLAVDQTPQGMSVYHV